jgi:hypothetical protein
VEAVDEPAADVADVDHYEQLRRRALDGEASGWRLGLAVLQRQGVAAWARAWRATPVASTTPPPADPPAGAHQVVGVLASMALACLQAR